MIQILTENDPLTPALNQTIVKEQIERIKGLLARFGQKDCKIELTPN